MENSVSPLDLIDMMLFPSFCVRDQKIIRVNEAAKRAFLKPDMEIMPLLTTGLQEYASFREGCLYLTLTLAGENQGVTVTRVGDVDIFLADEQTELQELQVLALAAQELRMPLSNVILAADQLGQRAESTRECAARLNRGTAQLQRMICNMSDALRFLKGARYQVKNVTALISEILEKAGTLSQHTGVSFRCQLPQEDIFTLVDEEQLERAIYNLVSNSLKFTPAGGTVEAILARKGKLLRLTVQDSGSGISDGILKNIYTRYLRQPSLEDSRHGLGLGMVLIRAAARNHGGTVLVDRPGEGARVSMTLAIRKPSEAFVRSPVVRFDYAGERDHGLLELSESLPADLYLP